MKACKRTTYPLLVLIIIFQTFWLLLVVNTGSISEQKTKNSLPHVEVDELTPRETTCGTPPEDAVKTESYLFILVLSSVDGGERRAAIRETWASDHKTMVPKVILKFVIGTKELQPQQLGQLKVEETSHRDILLLHNFTESYYQLTTKMLYSFVEVDKLFKFQYLLKADDDTYIMLSTLLGELSERSSTKGLYWGYFDGRQVPKKQGKWKENSWFLCDRYLPFAKGGGYVLSSDVIHRLASNADGLQVYNSEDVSVGVWTSPYDIERKHDVRFDTEYVSRGCRNVYIVSHKQSIDDMKTKYNSLKQTGRQCVKEVQNRGSYEYDWNVSPSECCKRQPDIP